MTAPLIITALGLILLIPFLIKRVKGACAEAAVLKSIVSIGFIATAVAAIISNNLNGKQLKFGILILGGLVFGLLGDIWLDLKYAHKESEKTYMYAGMICFILGHLMYVVNIFWYFYPLIASRVKWNDTLTLFGVPIASAIFMMFSEKPMKVNYGQYKAVTTVYAMFLSALPAIALIFMRLAGYKNIPLLFLGAASIFFVISDFILTGTYFGKGKDRPVDIIVNHITYYIAQYLIALSLCFLK